MSHDDQGQAGARWVQRAGFLFGAREASHRRGVLKNQPKVSILVQQDQDHQDGRMEVIAEPTTASRPEALQVQTDTSPSYLLFQTLLPLFWTLICMI